MIPNCGGGANPTNREETQTDRAGVTVERTLECMEEEIRATLRLRSKRDEPVLVHVVDDDPSNIPVEDVSFKPGAEPDRGNATDERVTIRQLVEDDPVEIVYGIVPSRQVTDVQWGPVTIESMSTAGYKQDEFSRCESAEELNKGDVRTLLDDIFGDYPREKGEKANSTMTDSNQPSEMANSKSEDRAEDDKSNDNQPNTQEVHEDYEALSVQRRMNPHNATDNGSAAEKGVSPSFEVRINHLSARVEELSAYATSLEGIIDKYGTGTEVIDTIEDELSDLDDRINTVDKGLESLRDSYWDEIGEVRHSIDAMDEEIQSHDGTLEDLQTDVSTQGSTLETVESNIRTHADRLDGLDDEVKDLRLTLETVNETVSTIGEDVVQLQHEIEDIHEEIADLKSFRKSLAEISNVE